MRGLVRTSIATGAFVLLVTAGDRAASPEAGPSPGAAAEKALFSSAIAAYPPRTLDDLGIPGRSFETARASFERLLREHPAGEHASAAEFRLGLLLMDPANPRADLDAARATFERLVRRAPRPPEAPAALEAGGLCLRLKGRSSEAAALDVRLVAEYPTDAAAARARVRLAREAAVRGDAGARGLLPDGNAEGAAGTARDLGTLLERAAEEKGSDALDPEFASPPVKEPVSVTALGSEAILVLDGSSGRIVSAGEGAPLPVAAADPPPEAPRRRGVAVDPRGRAWIWDEKGVTPPDGARVEPRGPAKNGEPGQAVKRIAAIAPGLMGTIDVLDASGEQVLRYGPGFVLRGVVPLPARPISAARAEDGTLDVLLASRPRQVLEIRAGAPVAPGWPLRGSEELARGWETTTIALKGEDWELGSPVAIARDALGRIYVLDDDARSVTLLDRRGRRAATYAADQESGSGIRSPASLAVDGSGRVYVADRKLGRVVRFR